MKEFVAIAALCTLLGSAAFAQLPSPLSEEEFKASGHKPIPGNHIREMILGNTGYLVYLSDMLGKHAGDIDIAYWHSDSRLKLVTTDNNKDKKRVAEIHWWIEGDHYCIKAIAKPTADTKVPYTRCRNFYNLGGVIYQCLDGQCAFLLRIVSGNSEKL